MSKSLVTIIKHEEEDLWINIDCDTIIIQKSSINTITNLSEIIIVAKYPFYNIHKFIRDYSEQYIMLFHVFLLKDELLKINEQNIKKLIKEYKFHLRKFPIVYLYRYAIKILDIKFKKKKDLIEVLKF